MLGRGPQARLGEGVREDSSEERTSKWGPEQSVGISQKEGEGWERKQHIRGLKGEEIGTFRDRKAVRADAQTDARLGRPRLWQAC